jgi:hypothetical protein
VAEKLPHEHGEIVGELRKQILEGRGNKCTQKEAQGKRNEYGGLKKRRRGAENVVIFVTERNTIFWEIRAAQIKLVS